MSGRLLPILELVLASAIWGFAFVAQRKGNESLNPLLFNGLRFLMGALVLLVAAKWLNGNKHLADRRLRAELAILGGVLFVAASLQQIGLLWTSAGSAGFITGLYVVFVPLIGIWRKQKTGRAVALSVLLAVAGLWLINRDAGLNAGFGNLLVLISAVFWAIHVQLIDKLTQRYSSLDLAIGQYTVCAILSILFWGLGQMFGVIEIKNYSTIAGGVVMAIIPLLYGGMASVGIAYTLQLHAQKRVAPAPASIILCLEAVFALLGGWLLLSERLSPASVCGAGLLMAAMLISVFASRVSTSEILIDKNRPSTAL